MKKQLQRRYRKDKVFRVCGLLSIILSFLIISLVIIGIIFKSYNAFIKTEILVDLFLEPTSVQNYQEYSEVEDILSNILNNYSKKLNLPNTSFNMSNIFSLETIDYIIRNQNKINQTSIWIPVSYKAHYYLRQGKISNLKESDRILLDYLFHSDKVRTNIDLSIFTNGDSRSPEMSGIKNSLYGSFLTLLISLLISVPLSILTSVYLEEYSKSSIFTDIVEININNLASVPSIVFGILGISIFIGFFDMPRSSPLVGGLTLGLMIMPIMIVSTRNSLQSIPPSLKQNALAMGATKMQVMFHHYLPTSLPGIITGIILGISRIFGETAPLILIGMVAFIKDIPQSFTDSSTVLPVQIYLWTESPEVGFIERSSAAIVILILIIMIINIIAIKIRNKYQIKW